MKRTRIPFGYDIIDGRARINVPEADRLKKYFGLYLAGLSMSAAAREAGLPCSVSSFPHFFARKEYTGTDYYPPIITADYQKQLVDEWQRRKSRNPRRAKGRPQKAVTIYTDFWLADPAGEGSNDPAAYAAALYRRIRGRYRMNP